MDFDIDELSEDPRFAAIRVCLTHGGLYEERPDPDTGHQQRCHDREGEPTWKGYEFNEWIRLCDCCLAVPMRSGSRWSPFFCERCRPEIIAADQGIPIGRHSMMNRVAPSNLTSIIEGTNRLQDWKSQRVRHLTDTAIDPALAAFRQFQREPHDTVLDLLIWWNEPNSKGDLNEE